MELHSENTVLVVMDVQEKLFNAMPDTREEMASNCRKLLKTAGILNIPVILTEQYPQGLGSTIKKIKEALPGNSKIFAKNEFSCAKNEKIIADLQKLGKKDVVLCGLEAHICIYQTSRDLAKLGYNVFVPIDAVHSRKKLDWKTGIRMMGKYAASTTTETVIFDLLKTSDRKEFKEVNRIIKER